MSEIRTTDGITIDYSKVIGIELDYKSQHSSEVRVIFATRKEYIYNPNTESFELTDITHEARFKFTEYPVAKRIVDEMKENWRAITE